MATADGFVVGNGAEGAGLDTAGKTHWSHSFRTGDAPGDSGYPMHPEVVVAHDQVYVRLVDGRLYALGAREERG